MLRTIFSVIFILLFSVIYYINNKAKDNLINSELSNAIKELQINFDITNYNNSRDVESVNTFINQNKKIFKILSKALDTDEKKRDKLREELYKLLHGQYQAMRKRGILQFQFVFPDSTSFLRMHKPSKYGDYLGDVRYSFKYTNKTKQPFSGFEQGRTAHAFRNVFPLYNDDKKYVGCYEVSYTSESMQNNLTNINKIHSHFLINKEIFNTKAWKKEDLVLNYVLSIENDNYMFTITDQLNKTELINSKKHLIDPNRALIAKNMKASKKFALYQEYKDKVKVIAFLPIKNLKELKTIAYIVSYTDNPYISGILLNHKLINIVSFFSLFIILYLIYLQFKQTNILKSKTQEQKQLLSLFDKGTITLFKWRSDEEWSVEYVSDNVKELTGFTTNEFIDGNVRYTDIIKKDDLAIVSQEVKNAIETKEDIFTHKPYRITTKKKKEKWLFDTTYIVKNSDDEITHFLGYIIDITDMKHQEIELITSRENLNQAQSDAKIGSYTLNLIDNSIKWSSEHFKITREDENNYIPTFEGFLSHVHPDDINFIKNTINETISTLQENTFEYRLLFDNEVVHVRSTSHISKIDESGSATEMTGTIQDITSKKLLEIKLQELNENLQLEVNRQTDENLKKDKILQEQLKLAAMGEMVGAIAHQWRQPLNSLNINIQNLDDDYADNLINEKFIDKFIEKQTKTIHFMSKTIDDFRNFFRVDKIKKIFSIRDAINTTTAIAEAQLKNYNITLDISGDDFEIETLESELHQILLNIISNAKDEIISKRIEYGKINITIEKNRVLISDNAGGIPNEIIHRIFEPYFTTKEQGNGTGMGLYMSKVIVEQNIGGTLSVRNKDDGAEFIITFNEVL